VTAARPADPKAAATRPPTSDLLRSQRRALLFVAVGVLACGGLLLAVMVDDGLPGWWSLVPFPTGLLWAGAGIFAWWRRPGNGVGALLVWGGFGFLLSAPSGSGIPWLAMIGAEFGAAQLAVLVHLLHAFPGGRLRGRLSILTVASVYVVSFVLQIPKWAFDGRQAHLPLFVEDRPGLQHALGVVQSASGTLVMVATVVVLVSRIRHATPFSRRVLVPLYLYGILTAFWVPFSANVLRRGLDVPEVITDGTQNILLAGIPIAFALAVVRGGFARTGELQELSSWLSARDERRTRLGIALASVLGDPSLQLLFWVPGAQRYVDADGRRVTLPQATASRAVVAIELSGEPIGAVVYDAELIADPELVRAAGRVVALGVDRDRLTAALRVTEQSLRRSRERIVETADRERRRIAQDLHDGLQVKLVLLALEAQHVANGLPPGASTRDQAIDLRHGIDAAAAELRALVHAVMPSALLERGLAMATEDLLDRLPLRSLLEVTDVGPLPMSVQSTAYFVVAEAVANVVKHADADTVRVHVTETDGVLTVDVEDDGVGGAAIGLGTGIRGLLDRVDVLGGELQLISPPGLGTRLTVRLPMDTARGTRVPGAPVEDATP
jgi:signal transduction histidine kinase